MLKDFGDTGTLGYTNMQSAHFAFSRYYTKELASFSFSRLFIGAMD